MASVENYEKSLLRTFIESFEKLDDMKAVEHVDPITWQLAAGNPDAYGRRKWRPIEVTTEPECLDLIYAELPARFPHLYERLILLYRWAEVDLRSFTLLANPPGPGLNALQKKISGDPTLWKCLRKAGYIQFGKGPGGNYDPVCFDIKSRKKKRRDCGIVQIDHEEVLCYDRTRIVKEIAPSFEDLVKAVIRKAGLVVPDL